jgi:Tol biopolymer transport system component
MLAEQKPECLFRNSGIHFVKNLLFLVIALSCCRVAAQPAPTVQPLAAPYAGFSTVGAGRDSTAPVLSGDGKTVAFVSQANDLVTNDHNGVVLDIFVRNLTNQGTSLVSINAGGLSGGGGNSISPSLSTDGRFIAFESVADDLVANDTNHVSDIFVRDVDAGTTTLVSVNAAGTGSGGARSFNPTITPDGRKIVFESLARNLVTNEVVGWDVYLRDLQAGTTTWVSTNGYRSGPGTTNSQNAISEKPAISANGRFVAYSSSVSNIFYPSNSADLFVRDLETGATALVSTNVSNVLTNPGVAFDNLVLSSNGQYLAYKANGSNATAIFWHNLQSGAALTITTNTRNNIIGFGDSTGPAMSADGRWVAFEITNSIYLWDSQSQTARVVYADTLAHTPLISGDGRYVSFLASSTVAARLELLVYDSVARQTNLVSLSSDGITASSADVGFPTMSENGRVFAFQAFDGNLIANDNNRATDIFVRDLDLQTTQLASQRHSSLPWTLPRGFLSLAPGSSSRYGPYMVFSSDADNLVPNDTNGCRDVFIRDVLNQTTILVSVNTNGTSANNGSSDPVMSADGRFVAFVSRATDLVAGSTNGTSGIYLRDLSAGTTQLIGPNAYRNYTPLSPGISADGGVIAFQIYNTIYRWSATNGLHGLASSSVDGPVYVSANGRRIAFIQDGSFPKIWDGETGFFDSAAGSSNIRIHGFSGDGTMLCYSADSPISLYLRDLAAQTNLLIATGLSGEGATMTDDARYIAYSQKTFNPNNNAIFVWDNILHTNILASPAYYGQVNTNGSSDNPVISPNGRSLIFASRSADLIAGDTNRYWNVYLRDLQTATTTLLSTNPNGSMGDHASVHPLLGADGTTVIFISAASDLIANDFNRWPNQFYFRLPSANFTDSDGDGMDDNWERKYFGDLSHDGTTDTDGDGETDLQEYRAGTNPLDKASVFKGTRLVAPNNGPVSINWLAQPGRGYRLQYKNNLTDSNWFDLATPMTVSGSGGSTTDNSAAGAPQRFYRLYVVP